MQIAASLIPINIVFAHGNVHMADNELEHGELVFQIMLLLLSTNTGVRLQSKFLQSINLKMLFVEQPRRSLLPQILMMVASEADQEAVMVAAVVGVEVAVEVVVSCFGDC